MINILKIISLTSLIVFSISSLSFSEVKNEVAVKDEAQHPSLLQIKKMIKYMKMYRDEKKEKLSPEEKAKNEEVKKRITSILDIPAMAKAAIGKYWEKETPEKRNKYAYLLERLVEKIAYPSSKEYFNKIEIKYDKVEKLDDNKYIVKTIIIDKEADFDVNLDFKLHKTKSGWRVYDVITDGDSLVLDYKNQFISIIKEKGFNHLIKLMERRLKK